MSDLPNYPPSPPFRQAMEMQSYYKIPIEAQMEVNNAADAFRKVCLKWGLSEPGTIKGVPISFPVAEHFRKLGYDEGKRVGAEAIYRTAQTWLKEQEK